MSPLSATTRRSGLWGMAAGVLLPLALGGILWAWWRDRKALMMIFDRQESSLTMLGHSFETRDLQLRALERSNAETQTALLRIQSDLAALLDLLRGDSPTTRLAQDDVVLQPSSSSEEDIDLPTLPEGISAQATIRRRIDVTDLLKD